MHLWGLGPGARLPGIRALARETGVDHRIVAQAYRTLEAEGLVEVRGRSGVYAASTTAMVGDLPADTAGWLTGAFAEARRRRIPLPDVPDLIRRGMSAVPLRCACAESTEDQVVAYSWELAQNYGLQVIPVYLPPSPHASPEPGALRSALAEVDLVVTTLYHANTVCPVAAELDIPAVLVAIDPDAVRDVADVLGDRLGQGRLTVITVDRAFADRLRSMGEGVLPGAEKIRYLLAEDSDAIAKIQPDEPVILTRAARDRLGSQAPPAFLLHAPIFAPQTVNALCAAIVRLNLEADA